MFKSSVWRCLPLLAALSVLPAPAALAGEWVGSPAPAFSLPDQDGKLHSLAEYRGSWLVLYFYPRDNTPGCTEEAQRFRDTYPEFRKLGAQVVGVSLDGVGSHKEFAQQHKLPFTLLADNQRQLASQLGVVQGFGKFSFASRETFLIDPQGTVVYHYGSVDTGKHAEQVLADIRRLRSSK